MTHPDRTARQRDRAPRPHPAWERLRAALIGTFASVGADINLARGLSMPARQAGLLDVEHTGRS